MIPARTTPRQWKAPQSSSRSSCTPGPSRAVAAAALLLVQVPLSLHSWSQLPGIHNYFRVMAAQYGEVARNPVPDRACVDQLTVCGLGPELRVRAVDMLWRHRLGVFSPAFAERHPDLAAAAGPLPAPPED